MKKILFLLLLCVSAGVSAQNLKFGHINSAELMEIMPQRDSIDQVLKAEVESHEQTLAQLENMIRAKEQSLQMSADSSDLVIKQLQQELQMLYKKYQDYQVYAQQTIEKKQMSMYNPLMESAKKAISDVGKENDFIYIFDLTAGNLLYFSDKSVDIMPLVKKKLNIID